MTSTPQNDYLQKLRHDLRAPLINIQGYASEISDALSKLAALVDSQEQSLPADFNKPARGLIDDDVIPCLGFLSSSVVELDKRLDELTSTTTAGAPAE